MHISSRALGRSIALAALLGTAACDLPTSGAPKWNTTWQVPADSGEISVATLLPPTVSIVDVGTTKAFDVAFGGANIAKSLQSACQACAAANGQRVPKPAFTLGDSASIPLPNDVASADLVGGMVDYTVTQDFGFDPLSPSSGAGAEKGWLVVRVKSGSDILAADSLNGASTPFASGASISRSIAVAATPTSARHISGPITVTTTLYSPAGDSVTIDASRGLHLTVTPNAVRVSQAAVVIATSTLISRQESVDLSGLGGEVSGRVQGGSVVVTVRNPFAVVGSLTATLTAPGQQPVTRQLELPLGGLSAPPALLRVPLTGEELARLMGSNDVTVAITGSVSVPGGILTVTPTQVFGVSTMLEIILSTTGR